MKKYSTRKIVFLLATLFLLLACELPFLPAPAASTTAPAPGSLETIVAATAGAAQTQTMMALPSPTRTMTATMPPTSTPTETPTATETVIFSTATKPPTATEPFSAQSAGSNCELVAQTPGNDIVYESRERFTTEWTLKNTGSESWLGSNIDFFHSGGRDMHSRDVYDLPRNVGAGGEVTFTIDMRAPADSGTYTSNWTLGTPKNALCKVSVRIIVK